MECIILLSGYGGLGDAWRGLEPLFLSGFDTEFLMITAGSKDIKYGESLTLNFYHL
jgi:hypothetical protein